MTQHLVYMNVCVENLSAFYLPSCVPVASTALLSGICYSAVSFYDRKLSQCPVHGRQQMS